MAKKIDLERKEKIIHPDYNIKSNQYLPAFHISILGIEEFASSQIPALMFLVSTLSDLDFPSYPSSCMSYQSQSDHTQRYRPGSVDDLQFLVNDSEVDRAFMFMKL